MKEIISRPIRADNDAAYPGKRKRDEGASADETLEESLARRVRTEEITLSTLKTKLLTHVDQVDATEALEFITRSGRADANATRGQLSGSACDYANCIAKQRTYS